jgi:hypothetical protein
MQLTSLIKKLDGIDKPKSSAYLYEGLNTSNKKSVFLWESAGKKLIEANLTVDQINQIFADVEQKATAAGSNRTLIGKGKDAASAVNKAWEDLKTKVQNSGPIKNVDAMYDQAAEKLKQATGGDQGVMKYVQMYRDFAKKHPIAQSFIYAALIAAAGISGAGLGGAAALGLFKMTDKLLQGEKFSSAAYQGAKTGGMAYAAGQIGQAMKGDPAASTGSPGEGSYTSYPPPTNPDGSLMTPQEINAAKDSLRVGADATAGAAQNTLAATRQAVEKEVIDAIRSRIANGEIAPGDQGAIRDLAYKMLDGSGMPPQAIETSVEKLITRSMGDVGSSVTNTVSGITGDQIVNHPAYQAMIQKFGDSPGARRAAMSAAKAAISKGQMNESKSLTTYQINLIFEHVSDSIILEGIWDSLKGAAGKAVNWAQTKGANLTNKVTADKLQQAWKAAGSPTDSEEVKKILQSAGVDAGIIDQAFTTIGVQSSSTAQPTTPNASTTQGQPTPNSVSTRPPTIKVSEINKTIPTLKLKDLKALQKLVNDTLAKRSTQPTTL